MHLTRFDQKAMKYYEQDKERKRPEWILQWVWDAVTVRKDLAMLLLQALPFLDAELYPVLKALGAANEAEPEGGVSYHETRKRGKWNVHVH